MKGQEPILRIPGERFRSIELWSSSFFVEVCMIRISVAREDPSRKEESLFGTEGVTPK